MFPIFCSSNTLFPHASVVGENTQQRLGWHIAGTPTGAKVFTGYSTDGIEIRFAVNNNAELITAFPIRKTK